MLTGFGGVIGVNHAVDEEAFRNGLRTKALDDVLFPKDPVANASRILATLRSVFPATGDKAIVGIAAEFSYLASKRVVIRLGVIVQFGESGPERIVILGQLKVSAPGEKNGLLSLNADLFGVVQWGEKQVRIAIDTRLYDSKIGAKGAEFVITGSLSIRVTLGCDSMFLLTAGGFRPDFEAPPSCICRPSSIASASSSTRGSPASRWPGTSPSRRARSSSASRSSSSPRSSGSASRCAPPSTPCSTRSKGASSSTSSSAPRSSGAARR